MLYSLLKRIGSTVTRGRRLSGSTRKGTRVDCEASSSSTKPVTSERGTMDVRRGTTMRCLDVATERVWRPLGFLCLVAISIRRRGTKSIDHVDEAVQGRFESRVMVITVRAVSSGPVVDEAMLTSQVLLDVILLGV